MPFAAKEFPVETAFVPDYPNFSFTLQNRDSNSRARTGALRTPHGVLETPNFIFCATRAAIKGVSIPQVIEAGANIILANTYHLFLAPGADRVAAHGGLHGMMQWPGPMLTDSGGFQIFSLGHGSVAEEIKGNRSQTLPQTLLKITEDGATFRSYIDGSIHTLTPEISIETQRKLGADLVVVLDECTPFHADKEYTARSLERSHRWELRSLEAFSRSDDGSQALYGIVQGGVHEDLRIAGAQFVRENAFFGQAVGGSLGGSKAQMHGIVDFTMRHLDPLRPTHLLGIGGITDILNGVACGIDTFDCVHPTRLARHGGALCHPRDGEGREHLNLKNARFKDDMTPLDPDSDFHYSNSYTRAYIHYLFKVNEALAGIILTLHNIHFMSTFARKIRESIAAGNFAEFRKEWTLQNSE